MRKAMRSAMSAAAVVFAAKIHGTSLSGRRGAGVAARPGLRALATGEAARSGGRGKAAPPTDWRSARNRECAPRIVTIARSDRLTELGNSKRRIGDEAP